MSSVALILSFLADAQELPPALERTVSYADEVHPLLAAKCYECHFGEERKGGFSMGTRDAVLEGSQYGPVVVPGDSAASRLVEVIAGLDPEVIMPEKGERLTAEQVGLLRAWIDQGLPWEETGVIAPQWVAPLHPRRPDVPAGAGIHGSDHPIDKFVAAYFEDAGAEAPPVVEDARFARRVYLNLIGLLPTVDELDAFVADPRPDKRAALVDDLLARDRDYAEHWITFWNDALRNDFEGTGYIDGGRKQITQWLYDALYYNRPFDQFAEELIHPSEGSRGFTDGIVWRGVVPAPQRPPLQAANSVAQVFLGVQLKCASCHDSFVDDWKLADSYGLANCFAEEPLDLVRCDVPLGRTAETRFLWPELGDIDADAPRGARMKRLAELITMPENGRFARTAVNRVWAATMGRGLVEPLDNMDREPWQPDLLDWLASEFVTRDYDMKELLRLIATSSTFQLEADPVALSADAPFRGPRVQRLAAEQFVDALARVTDIWREEPKFLPPDVHVAGPDVGVRAWRVPADTLTRALGRPNREQTVTRRPEEFTRLQGLELTNGVTLAALLTRGAEQLLEEKAPSPEALVETVYRRAIQRPPTEEERALATALVGTEPTREGVEDLLWSIALHPEFQLMH
ncbi:MAG: PSD1 and planctomycete cytochrome C domain-containing protein [Candidatus Hydrogenedentales bacterium]